MGGRRQNLREEGKGHGFQQNPRLAEGRWAKALGRPPGLPISPALPARFTGK